MIAMERSDKRSLRRYLLGEAAPEEQSTIEQRLLSEQEYFDELIRTEEELTDEYVRGELAGAEKKDFELHFVAHPERRDRVEFARTLNQYLARQSRRQFAATDQRLATGRMRWSVVPQPWRTAASVAACLLLTVVFAALVWQGRLLRHEIQQAELQRSQSEQHEQQLLRQIEQQATENSALMTQFEQQQSELNQLRRQLDRLLSTHTESTIASLFVTAGIIRSPDQVSTAVVSPSIQQLRLNLQVGAEKYKAYRAEVQTVEGDVVARDANLKAHESPDGRVVSLVLASAPLTRSDYLVMLDGISEKGSPEKVGTYYFKLVRKS